MKEQNKTVNLEDAIKICKIENGCVDNTCKGSCTEQQKKLDNINYEFVFGKEIDDSNKLSK